MLFPKRTFLPGGILHSSNHTKESDQQKLPGQSFQRCRKMLPADIPTLPHSSIEALSKRTLRQCWQRHRQTKGPEKIETF